MVDVLWKIITIVVTGKYSGKYSAGYQGEGKPTADDSQATVASM